LNIVFSYNLERDATNLVKGLRSINNPQPTPIESLYLDYAHGSINQQNAILFIREYIVKKNIDVESVTQSIANAWQQVRDPFCNRAEALFQCAPSSNIQGYVTVDTRCTYSIQENHFYISAAGQYPTVHILHELFHFYTWYGVSIHAPQILLHERYNDLKEALTELLNVLFYDLMDNSVDKGYPQHKKMRGLIRKLWHQHHNLYGLIGDPLLTQMLDSYVQNK
jgi:hypothetical protein